MNVPSLTSVNGDNLTPEWPIWLFQPLVISSCDICCENRNSVTILEFSQAIANNSHAEYQAENNYHSQSRE